MFRAIRQTGCSTKPISADSRSRVKQARHLLPLIILGLLAACVTLVPGAERPGDGVATPTAPTTTSGNAFSLGARRANPPAGLRVDAGDAATALVAFVTSCNVAQSRADLSGLTVLADWREPCAAAARWPQNDAVAFFGQYFRPVRVGDGQAYATGYFEPEIGGSRTRRAGFEEPVYGMPDDLVRAWPASTPASEREGRAPLGRYDNGRFVDYFDRAEIERGALAGRGLEIAYAADPVEFFFLQIQGSGRLITPEGEVIRIGYAGQNGHAYTGIGGVMRERGLLGSGEGQYAGSMQGIMQYIRENPRDGADLMRLNKSWVFFRVLDGPNAAIGPIGSIGVPVRGESSVAVDPKFVPYGAPVLLDTDRGVANGMWIAQDTGGAIRGPNRFDTFWGAGERAREVAGGMSARGDALILLPKSAANRLSR